MAEADARSILALRYMLDFRCIGSNCEDSCCQSGWEIYIDPAHLVKLRRALPLTPSDDPNALPTFDHVARMVPKKDRSERVAAQLLLDEKGRCPLLGPQLLCRLHQAKGEDTLPDTCAMYPRHLNQVGQRLELSGALSCPEVARRALLPSDATDLVPAPGALQGRGQRQFSAPPGPQALRGDDPQAPYRHLDVVRGTMVRLLSLSGFSLPSRLFFTCFLAHKSSALQSAPEAPIDPNAFLQQAELLSDPEVLAELDRRLHEGLVMAPLPLPLLLSVLHRQRQVPGGGAFARLVVEMAQSYRDPRSFPSTPDEPREVASPDEAARLDHAYRLRRQPIDALFRARIDHYLFNYARHFWMKDWYTHSPSLFLHTQSFLLRVALLRFVILGHPHALAAAQKGADAGQADLDALAVRAFYSLSRSIEHSAGFRAAILEYVAKSAPSMEGAIALLSV